MDDKTAKNLIASNLLIAKYLREILHQEKDDPKTAIEAKERIDRIMDDFNAIIKAISD